MNNKLPRKVSRRGVAKNNGLWYRLVRFLFRPILEEIERMTADNQAALDELAAAIARNTSVTSSAVDLITAIADQINDAADDPAEVRALAAQLKTSTDALAASVAANTPGEEPAPEPAPEDEGDEEDEE